MGAVTTRLLDWATASRALRPRAQSGDQFVVTPVPSGVLLAVVDGLGHGAEAEVAAEAAVDILRERAHESVISLLDRCHRRLRATRGAVLSLAVFNAAESTMTWLGVGNVEGVLLRADPRIRPPRESLILRPGVVGVQLPPLQTTTLSVSLGDTLIFATDGVRSDFMTGALGDDPPQKAADRILFQHGKGTDDALVLVARYVGGGAR